ncbi:hypothetical protein ABZS66_41740 [Dactylosporangium sp. NPDC005572]|uniref:hypothetical protein n=1 Tax=Dactylosporangium sp. NPDC005572 TaxID=3156889 RepID=UPI0033BE994A
MDLRDRRLALAGDRDHIAAFPSNVSHHHDGGRTSANHRFTPVSHGPLTAWFLRGPMLADRDETRPGSADLAEAAVWLSRGLV